MKCKECGVTRSRATEVYLLLCDRGPMTISQLVQAMDVEYYTLFAAVSKAMKNGLVVRVGHGLYERAQVEGARCAACGRKKRLWEQTIDMAGDRPVSAIRLVETLGTTKVGARHIILRLTKTGQLGRVARGEYRATK